MYNERAVRSVPTATCRMRDGSEGDVAAVAVAVAVAVAAASVHSNASITANTGITRVIVGKENAQRRLNDGRASEYVEDVCPSVRGGRRGSQARQGG